MNLHGDVVSTRRECPLIRRLNRERAEVDEFVCEVCFRGSVERSEMLPVCNLRRPVMHHLKLELEIQDARTGLRELQLQECWIVLQILKRCERLNDELTVERLRR